MHLRQRYEDLCGDDKTLHSEIRGAPNPLEWEQCKLGRESSGVVCDDEILARFVFDPQQIRGGELSDTTLFEDVLSLGSSVQRCTQICANELNAIGMAVAEGSSGDTRPKIYVGFCSCDCNSVRSIVGAQKNRLAVVCDTPQPGNFTHATIFGLPTAKKDKQTLRAELFRLFKGSFRLAA